MITKYFCQQENATEVPNICVCGVLYACFHTFADVCSSAFRRLSARIYEWNVRLCSFPCVCSTSLSLSLCGLFGIPQQLLWNWWSIIQCLPRHSLCRQTLVKRIIIHILLFLFHAVPVSLLVSPHECNKKKTCNKSWSEKSVPSPGNFQQRKLLLLLKFSMYIFKILAEKQEVFGQNILTKKIVFMKSR